MRSGGLALVFWLATALVGLAQDTAVCPYLLPRAERANMEKGLSLYQSRRFAESAATFRKVLGKHPKAPDPCFYLGMVAAKQNDNPGAIRRYFTRLHDLCPAYPHPLAHFYYAVVLYTDQRYDEAADEMQAYFDLLQGRYADDRECLSLYEEGSNYLYWCRFLSEAEANRVPYHPELIRGASTAADELLPSFAPDGSELYFLRTSTASSRTDVVQRTLADKETRLCVARRGPQGAYSAGSPLPPPFNQALSEGGVSLTADNCTLYYSRIEMEKGYKNCDICFATRQPDSAWGPIHNAGPNVNGAHSWESQPTLSADGSTLYFASNREGGLGGTDIWRCRRLPNGDWSRAENLGPSVNTPGNEKSPFLHADGHTLYFASDGWQGFGGYDMFVIDLRDTAAVRPLNLGLPLNGEQDETALGVTTDGLYGYLSTRTEEGIGGFDLYRFALHAAARPTPMALQRGTMNGADGRPTQGSVKVWRADGTVDTYPVAPDNRGRFAVVFPRTTEPAARTVMACYAEGSLPIIRVVESATTDAVNLTLPSAIVGAHSTLNTAVDPLLSADHLSPTGEAVVDACVDFLLASPRLRLRLDVAHGSDAFRRAFEARKLRPGRIEVVDNSGAPLPRLTLIEM